MHTAEEKQPGILSSLSGHEQESKRLMTDEDSSLLVIILSSAQRLLPEAKIDGFPAISQYYCV